MHSASHRQVRLRAQGERRVRVATICAAAVGTVLTTGFGLQFADTEAAAAISKAAATHSSAQFADVELAGSAGAAPATPPPTATNQDKDEEADRGIRENRGIGRKARSEACEEVRGDVAPKSAPKSAAKSAAKSADKADDQEESRSATGSAELAPPADPPQKTSEKKRRTPRRGLRDHGPSCDRLTRPALGSTARAGGR